MADVKDRQTLRYSPPVYEAGFRDGLTQAALRRLLAKDTLEQDRPQAIVQQGIGHEGKLMMLADYMAYQRRGGQIRACRLSDIDAEQAGEAGRLALCLGEDGKAHAEMGAVMRQERLAHDDYMGETAFIDIIHLPGAALLSWSMSAVRIGRLLDAQDHGDRPPYMWRNNPISALGVLVVPRAGSNHARIERARIIAEAHKRLVPIFRHRMGELPVELAAPSCSVQSV